MRFDKKLANYIENMTLTVWLLIIDKIFIVECKAMYILLEIY